MPLRNPPLPRRSGALLFSALLLSLPSHGTEPPARAQAAPATVAAGAQVQQPSGAPASVRRDNPATVPARPKLVLVLVVDGLPHEEIQRHRAQFGQGGFRRLLEQGAWYGNAHQAHGVTMTAVGHAAVLTGAYAYQHGVISNGWIDRGTLAPVYCTEDKNHQYLGEETKPDDGTSPANLKVGTIGDELRLASGGKSKVVAVSGKDRAAILLAGKSGTAYMYMDNSGRFASSTYYMREYPDWHRQFHAAKPADRYHGRQWQPLLPPEAYASDAPDASPGMNLSEDGGRFPFSYKGKSGQPDAQYYGKLLVSPWLDELTFDFARAAVAGENLGRNPAGAPDLLAVSLSNHDIINHGFGPESRMAHDHLLRLDRMLAAFLTDMENRVGRGNLLVVLTSDHGFSNTVERSQAVAKIGAQRIDGKKMLAALNGHLQARFDLPSLAPKWSFPNVLLDYDAAEKSGVGRAALEAEASRFLLGQPGIAHAFTRSQLETGALPDNRIARLMQRGWNRQVSGDILLVSRPHWYFSSGGSGTTHGSPYAYDTNVPLALMGEPWIRPGNYADYAEVVDIAPTLAHLLRLRIPSASEGRVLKEALRHDPARNDPPR